MALKDTKLAIFDMDGLLIESERLIAEHWMKLAERDGLDRDKVWAASVAPRRSRCMTAALLALTRVDLCGWPCGPQSTLPEDSSRRGMLRGSSPGASAPTLPTSQHSSDTRLRNDLGASTPITRE